MIILMLVLLGLCFGSFVNALAWRLRHKRDFVKERSECTHCHHVLAWYDLVPVLSWLTLGGKCRYCKKSIEDSPLTEIAVAIAFVVSYISWPFGYDAVGVSLLSVWLLIVVLLAGLLLYDLRWMLLPDVLNLPLIGLGIIWAVTYQLGVLHHDVFRTVLEIGLGCMSVAGIYGALYAVSKGEWIGFGDVKLGLFIGSVLGWQRGLIAVLLANIMAFLVVLPGLATGKINKRSRIPFGPFLIVATYIALLFGEQLVRWWVDFVFSA